ncbi:acyl-CoA dehydrogenase NM domain-like protein [Phellopilus nigrolimitatus]|nr:acyl-CoA dehydrogenase NM domain-like protein [Phellopilus nigrolimitatus]
MSTKELKQYTLEEIEKHNSPDDLWIIVDAKVYNVSRFADLHPGGAAVLLAKSIAGKDATDAFFGLHRHEVLRRPQYARLQIGTLAGETELVKPLAADALSDVPYAEPTWLASGFHSPYYTDSHRRFQKAVRKFVSEILAPEMEQCEQNGKRIGQSVVDKMSEANIHAMRLGPGKHLKGRTLMGGTVQPKEFDYFHDLIISFEYGRLGLRGSMDGLLSGGVIGLPPVLNYGSADLQARIVPDVLAGKKFICLAVSEAFAGSDVGGLQTTATVVRDNAGGKHWVVNGTKKWITNGVFADYFTTGCRVETEDGKDGGYVVLLIARGEGVETRPIKTSYSSTAGTAFVMFDNVKVPMENTIGKVGDGMRVILSNFNHERWMIVCQSARTQRLIVEECLKWANQRIVFGKPLISQAVVRSKIANMIARVEACQGWLESITHEMNNMTHEEQSDKLAGQIALLKQFITRCGREIAEDATQIFGGRGITMSGMGRLIENFHRTSPFDAILGGAEDVMGDLGVRQAVKKMPKGAKL